MATERARRFDRVDDQLQDVRESMVTALGLAAHANVRHDGVQKQIEKRTDRLDELDQDLRQRVQRLKEKV
jgi:hypothetical protein